MLRVSHNEKVHLEFIKSCLTITKESLNSCHENTFLMMNLFSLNSSFSIIKIKWGQKSRNANISPYSVFSLLFQSGILLPNVGTLWSTSVLRP